MKASWIVAAEPQRNCLRMKISGFFTVDDVAAFAATVAAEIAVLKRQAGALPHVTLCDTRGVQIQSQDAVAAFTAMLDNPAARSRRLAYVVDAALARMQIRRLTERSDAGYFDTVEAAEAWLFAVDADPALPGASLPATPAP